MDCATPTSGRGRSAWWQRQTWLVAIAFVVVVAVQSALVWWGYQRVAALTAAHEAVSQHALPAMTASHEAQKAVQERILLLLRMLAQPEPLERGIDGERFTAAGLAFARARDALKALGATDPELRAALGDIEQHAVALSSWQRRIVEALLIGDDDQARALIEEGAIFARQQNLLQSLQALNASQQRNVERLDEQVAALRGKLQRALLLLGVVIFLFGGSVGAAVTRVVSRREAALHAERERARQQAESDALTGLLNRRGLDAAVAQLAQQSNTQAPHALLAIDLDRFKPVNDSAGHEAGDACLQQIAQRLRDCTRTGDVVARTGGDEFVVVLPHQPLDRGHRIAQRICHAIASRPFIWNGTEYTLGASIGCTALVLEGNAQAQWRDALQRADSLCYDAKRRGRNQVVCDGDGGSGSAATIAAGSAGA
ncbi:MAG: diguanylate cyclase domain-containing protein [Tepidimonas sp.]